MRLEVGLLVDPARRRRPALELGDAGDRARPAQRRAPGSRGRPAARRGLARPASASGRACLRASRSARVRARMSSRIMTAASGAGRSGAASPARPSRRRPPAPRRRAPAAALQIGRRAADVQRRRRGHQRPRCAPPRAPARASTSSAMRALSAGVAAAQARRIALVQAEVGRARPRRCVTSPSASSATNVAPAGANSSRPPAPWTTSARRDPSAPCACASSSQRSRAKMPLTCSAHAGRVGQRPEQVEQRAEAELLARARPRAWSRRGARARTERPASPRAGSAPTARAAAPGSSPSASMHVVRARLRRLRAVAVLGDRHARARDHERGDRRDVDRPRAVAAGAAGVDHRLGRRTATARHARPHRARRADHLVDRLALHAQRRPAAPPICAGVASPSMISPTTAAISSAVRSRRSIDARQRLADRPAVDAHGRPPFAMKLREQLLARRGQERLGVELHALDGQRLVAHAHDLVLRRSRAVTSRQSGTRRALDHQRVVARRLERVRQPGEHALAVVVDRRRLAVHDPRGAHDLAAEGLADGLVAQADAQDRDLARRSVLITSRLMPASFGVHGPGEITMCDGRQRRDRRRRRSRRCARRARPPQLAQVLDQVVGERVVVVDHEQHQCSLRSADVARRAISTALSTARALLTHSSYSAAGTLSATMPAPACT